jgi:hypothetical protein
MDSGLKTQIEALIAECRELRKLHDKPKPAKDKWDKLGLSGPLVIALLGLLLTWVVQRNADREAEITRAAAERTQNLQSFSVFMQYLTSADTARQALAIRALYRLGNCDVAALVAGLNPTQGTQAGLLEVTRIDSIARRDDCGLADTVIERVFLPMGMQQVTDPTQLSPGLLPLETIPAPTIPRDTSPSLTDPRRTINPPPLR